MDYTFHHLKTIPFMSKWTEANNKLQRQFQFADFRQAFAFMTQVAFAAEEQQHHPDWCNVYNRVDISLSTHDANDTVTEKDYHLAKAIDKIYQMYAAEV